MASVASPALRSSVRQVLRVHNSSDHRMRMPSVSGTSAATFSARRPACAISYAHTTKCLTRLETWSDWRKCGSKKLRQLVTSHSLRRRGGGRRQLRIASEMAGQYEETFSDIDKHLLDQFTFKAVRSVLGQLQETNPPVYTFFYNFCVENRPQDGKIFIQKLVKVRGAKARIVKAHPEWQRGEERQELAERVMVTRLHLFNKWSKNYNHADLHKAITDQNLELLRERLFQTVKFSAEGEDPRKSTPP